jgi:hypothetical protein
MGSNGRGVTLDLWQRQAVLAAAALLRERFGSIASDTKAKAVHDALLEVLDPQRRAIRQQREMSSAAGKAAVVLRSERRGNRQERRMGVDRRQVDRGAPMGIERRNGPRRGRDDRRQHK